MTVISYNMRTTCSVNIGVLGHVDCGKTSLCKALTQVIIFLLTRSISSLSYYLCRLLVQHHWIGIHNRLRGV